MGLRVSWPPSLTPLPPPPSPTPLPPPPQRSPPSTETVVLTLTASGSVSDYSVSDTERLQQSVANAATTHRARWTLLMMRSPGNSAGATACIILVLRDEKNNTYSVCSTVYHYQGQFFSKLYIYHVVLIDCGISLNGVNFCS